jgi:TetR/AcrR family transcriptional regulator, transcriptional repressor for nem operon
VLDRNYQTGLFVLIISEGFFMKMDKKKELINIGAELMHLKGYNNTGVQEILSKAGLPKGSFYNYFKSKENFGLLVVDHYMAFYNKIFAKYMDDKSVPPLERIRRLYKGFNKSFRSYHFTLGCPIGNFAQELGDTSPIFQAKLKKSAETIVKYFSDALRDAQASGHLSRSLDADKTARYIFNSWEGAIMSMKVEKSLRPLEINEQFLFDYILKP